MTRAKKKLGFSSSGTSIHGKELTPARLLEDISSEYVSEVEVGHLEQQFQPQGALLRAESQVTIDATILQNLLAERGFSATSLNNYLRSPWDYFFRNVLRIPETQALPMQFGTAMHSVLEYVTRTHTTTGKIPNDSDIRKKLEVALNRLPVNAVEYTRLFEKGLEALMVYVPHMLTTLPTETKEEFKLRVHLATDIPALPEVVLTGNLDRIDVGADGYALRVVDYKTGKPKSRNVIEGNTKDSDGGYKRQLVFYALLLSLHDDERYLCREGKLSFVEPEKGVVKEETFNITEEEIESLKQEIVSAVKEIISGQFLQYVPEPDETDYFELAKRWVQ